MFDKTTLAHTPFTFGVTPRMAKDVCALTHETLFKESIEPALLVFVRPAIEHFEEVAKREHVADEYNVHCRLVDILALNEAITTDRGRYKDAFEFIRRLRRYVISALLGTLYGTLNDIVRTLDQKDVVALYTLLHVKTEEIFSSIFTEKVATA